MALRGHGAGELSLVDRPRSGRTLQAGAVHGGRVAGGGISGAVLSQRGQGRVLRENLGQEGRLEPRKAVLRQRPRCPRHHRGARWLSTAAGGQAAADQGEGGQVEPAGSPLLPAGLAALLQVVQKGAH